MKAITISQPYASLIASGKKWVENRNWRLLPSYRGELAIHAGKGSVYLIHSELQAYTTQAIVAVAELRTAVRIQHPDTCPSARTMPSSWVEDGLTELDWYYFLAHDHTEGPVCLVLGNVRKLREPIYCKGSLGLWNVPDYLEKLIRKEEPSE